MAETIGYDGMVRMLRGAAEKVMTQHETLSKLDAAIGDGDHGTAMRRAMSCLAKAVADSRSRDLAAVLNDVGWAILSAGGGSTGPLFGTFFMGMGEGVGDHALLDAAALAEAFETALATVRKQTKAELGDKTMIDALVPAVEGLRAAADEGLGPAAALERAAAAAEQGAASTKDMQARFGKAKNLGERTLGTPDPGAVSVSLLFRGMADGLLAAESD